MYTIKEVYTLHEMYLDKTGYSGWAEMANNEELFKESQRVELDEAKRFLSGYVKKYEENGSTKYKQSSEISKTPLKFVLVLMQVSNDTVSKLADISSYNLAKMVSDGYSGSDFSVVIKPHPRDVRFKPNMVNNKDAIIVNDSIYSLIPKSSAVYTVNSGAGFESLLYRKPVFTSGHNDYHWVTTRVRNRDDIEKTKSQFDIDKDSIVKFLYYFLNEYVITYDNKEQIRRKIMKIMNGANNADRRV
jgi:capsule polysaccharide export protein KpsC/LpsZ